jgi:hypothetical protein
VSVECLSCRAAGALAPQFVVVLGLESAPAVRILGDTPDDVERLRQWLIASGLASLAAHALAAAGGHWPEGDEP